MEHSISIEPVSNRILILNRDLTISIHARHDLHDDIDRENMLAYPFDDDYELHIYVFADRHNPTQLYVVGPGYQSLDSMLDLVVLYSPEPL